MPKFSVKMDMPPAILGNGIWMVHKSRVSLHPVGVKAGNILKVLIGGTIIRKVPSTLSNYGQLISSQKFESYYQTDLALKYMESQKDNHFLLFVSYGPPHTPYKPPPEFNHYCQVDIEWHPNVPEELRGTPRLIREICGYYGLCETVDQQVERLLAYLDKSGLVDNIIVFFTADHGDCHGSHGLYRKGHPEEESLGIPLIIRHPPSISKGVTSETLVSTVDFPCILLSMCGLKIPEMMVGRDFSWSTDGKSDQTSSIYTEGRMSQLKPLKNQKSLFRAKYGAWRSVINSEYKLVVDYTGKVQRLSDLKNDPFELRVC